MERTRRQGFSLIELLTVIAIIAILAGFVFVAFPRIREGAKRARTQNAFIQIRTAAVEYFAASASYPPGYGFIGWDAREVPADQLNDLDYHIRPYTALLGIHGDLALYDEWSAGFDIPFDADRNGSVGFAEFVPVGLKKLSTNKYVFPSVRFAGSDIATNDPEENSTEFARMTDAERRPFAYIPVNLRQYEKARRYWIEQQDWYAENWDYAAANIASGQFPPAKYDAFALVSMGPGGDTFGVVPSAIGGTVEARDRYHVLSLRAYFLATRDLNQNNLRDFDYIARTQEGEARATYPIGSETVTNRLPSERAPDGYGPMIFLYP